MEIGRFGRTGALGGETEVCPSPPTLPEPSPVPGMAGRTETARASILGGARRAAEASRGVGSLAGWLLGGLLLLGFLLGLQVTGNVLLNSAMDDLTAGESEGFAHAVEVVEELGRHADVDLLFGDAFFGHKQHGAESYHFYAKKSSSRLQVQAVVLHFSPSGPPCPLFGQVEAESTRGAMRCSMMDESLDCRELWQELEAIGERVERAYPANHRLRKLFRPIVDPEDFTPPTIDQLVKARAAFFGLPVAEQRRILNGWEPWPGRWSPDPNVPYLGDALADLTTRDDCPARVLLIRSVGKAKAAERSARGWPDGPMVAQTFLYCAGATPVEVTVKEGTSREEAIEAMQSAIDLIQRDWGNLISKECVAFPGVV